MERGKEPEAAPQRVERATHAGGGEKGHRWGGIESSGPRLLGSDGKKGRTAGCRQDSGSDGHGGTGKKKDMHI